MTSELLEKGAVLSSGETAQSVREMPDFRAARPGEVLLLLQQVGRAGQPRGRVGHSRGDFSAKKKVKPRGCV